MINVRTKTTLSKIMRDEIQYEQMVYRCELHNAQVKTTTRMATPEENEHCMKLLEQDKYERELAAKEKSRFYEYEARRNA